MTEAGTIEEIVHVVPGASAPVEEEVAAVAAVLSSWAYDVRVLAPIGAQLRRRLAGANVRASQAIAPSAPSLAARWSAARALAAQLRELRPMLIHAHGFLAGFAALLARRSLPGPTPIVLSPNFLPHLLAGPGAHLRQMAYRRVLRSVDAIVVQTEVQRRQLFSLDPASADRAEVVPCGISSPPSSDGLDLGVRRRLLGMTQAAAIIGCVVDTLDPPAVRLFLDAARALCMEYPSLEFALIGSGVDRPEYHQLAHRRSLMGATVFVDPYGRIDRALAALNVLVIPQRGWPSGMLALQALSQDVGVIALTGSEVDEMLGGAPCVTVAPGDDAAALADAVITQLRAAADRMPMSAEAVDAPGVSQLLVSREFFDLSQPWGRSEAPSEPDEDEQSATHTAAAAFPATRAARALIAVYHRVLDRE